MKKRGLERGRKNEVVERSGGTCGPEGVVAKAGKRIYVGANELASLGTRNTQS